MGAMADETVSSTLAPAGADANAGKSTGCRLNSFSCCSKNGAAVPGSEQPGVASGASWNPVAWFKRKFSSDRKTWLQWIWDCTVVTFALAMVTTIPLYFVYGN